MDKLLKTLLGLTLGLPIILAVVVVYAVAAFVTLPVWLLVRSLQGWHDVRA